MCWRPPADKPLTAFAEAKVAGAITRPVLVGPVTFLLLAKPAQDTPAGFEPLSLLDRIVPLFAQVLQKLRSAGAEWVQLDSRRWCSTSRRPSSTQSPGPTRR